MANKFMLKWRITEDERAKLADSYNELQAEGIVTRARLQDAWKKEVEETLTQLTKRHEQALALANAKAKEEQDTLELIVKQYHENAKIAMEELEANRAQISMDDTRIKILIDRHRQHLTKKIEETFGRAGEEWAAQAVELHMRFESSFFAWLGLCFWGRWCWSLGLFSFLGPCVVGRLIGGTWACLWGRHRCLWHFLSNGDILGGGVLIPFFTGFGLRPFLLWFWWDVAPR